MPIDLQDRSQYLSLALFSQKIISALMGYVDENRSAKLKPSLEEALTSLRSIQTKHFSQRAAVAFPSYEHLRTLEEVWSPQERTDAVKMIQALLRGSPKDPKLVADRLIDLFSRLQNQALWNYEQPKPVSAGVMQRLCQLA